MSLQYYAALNQSSFVLSYLLANNTEIHEILTVYDYVLKIGIL